MFGNTSRPPSMWRDSRASAFSFCDRLPITNLPPTRWRNRYSTTLASTKIVGEAGYGSKTAYLSFKSHFSRSPSSEVQRFWLEIVGVICAKRTDGALYISTNTQKEKLRMFSTNTMTRSNHDLFIPYDTGSPHDSLMAHIAGLGPIARLDFERCAVAGEVIYAVEGDSAPVSQQAEEARIGTLAYAIKKLGNAEDAAEFIRCLNLICEDGDARCRQSVASHYFNEIDARGVSDLLKEMGLLAMQFAGLNPVTEVVETETPDSNLESEPAPDPPAEPDPNNIQV